MHPHPAIRVLLRLTLCVGLAAAAICHADDLTDRVVQAFRTKLPTRTFTVKDADELEMKDAAGQSTTIYLDNLRKSCGTDPSTCGDATTNLVEAFAGLETGAKTPTKLVRDKLYPVLRHTGYAAQASRLAKDPAKGLVMQPFAPDMELLFIIDGERTITYLTQDEAREAGMDTPALLKIGADNVSRLAKVKAQPIGHREGLFVLPFGDSLGCTRMFDAALWNRIEADAGGPVAVAVATRDWILFTRLDNAEHVAQLRDLAGRVAQGEAYGVSGTLLKRAGTGWVPVTER